ncbi:MAG TPA: SURF1 family protein [Burkholderiaceae bacterium]|jgi:surfeit locus 1 family protein
MRRLVVLIAAVLACALTARLGIWQLDRASQKLALQARMEEQAKLPALGNADLSANPDAIQRRVVLHGRWQPERTVWLDNRPMSGRVGFFVVTPLLLDGTGQTILVQRGWLPRNQLDRTALPPLITPMGNVEVQGRLALTPSRLFEFTPSTSGVIRQNLDVAAYAREIHQALLPVTVWQTGPGADGDLKRDWAAPDLGLQTHYGYAFQWFALCALILGLYVWFQLVKPRRR